MLSSINECCAMALLFTLFFCSISSSLLVLFSSSTKVKAVSSPSTVNDMSVDEFLEYVNPPALHKYLDKDGDPILCVRFEDQLSLRLKSEFHPNLKKMSIGRKGIGYSNKTWCPPRTLALREVTKEDVVRVGGIPSFLRRKRSFPLSSHVHPTVGPEASTSHEYAAVEFTSNDPMFGTKATHSVWKPLVADDGHFSLAQVWLSENSRTESIEAGWHVYPMRYGDDRPRFFIYWTADRYQNTGCYNTYCPGFVLVDDFVLRGKSLKETQYLDRSQYEIPISIYLSEEDANEPSWQLEVYGRRVGYWPAGLFSSLSDSATLIVYGGEVSYNSMVEGQILTRTDMGSGHFASEGWRSSANIRQIKFLRANNTEDDGFQVNMSLVASKPNCYDVIAAHDKYFGGLHIFYGGPGGDASDCISSSS